MIPKIIHYVWVGGGPLTPLAEKCIESWKKFCPDYEIKRWDETNFDINQNIYCKEAYESKKWAFVSDYIRAKVLYDFGGIYLDTDVELVKNIDVLLQNDAFCGFENFRYVAYGLGFGSKKDNAVLSEMLEYYDRMEFLSEDGTLNQITCPVILKINSGQLLQIVPIHPSGRHQKELSFIFVQ